MTVFSLAACQHAVPSRPGSGPASQPSAAILVPSPRLIVGRVVATDPARGFAFVEVAADAPEAALAEGAELVARTLELKDTGRIRASRYVRGRTLGATILSGEPAPGDEVVWLAP